MTPEVHRGHNKGSYNTFFGRCDRVSRRQHVALLLARGQNSLQVIGPPQTSNITASTPESESSLQFTQRAGTLRLRKD